MQRLALAAPIWCLMLLAGACSPSRDPAGGQSVRLIVFAAASLNEAFSEIASEFEVLHPDIAVTLSFAGSQQLSQQLRQGAPADVFASADAHQMETVLDAGRIEDDKQRIFARNRLTVVMPADNPAGLTKVADLAQPGLKLVLAAAEVPAGRYSLDFLNAVANDGAYGAQFQAGALNNVVSYEESVRAVLRKVTLGEADAGVVYESDVTGAPDISVSTIRIPDEFNVSATYPIAPLSDSGQPEQAQLFVDFVLSPQGQAKLASHGLLPAGTEK